MKYIHLRLATFDRLATNWALAQTPGCLYLAFGCSHRFSTHLEGPTFNASTSKSLKTLLRLCVSGRSSTTTARRSIYSFCFIFWHPWQKSHDTPISRPSGAQRRHRAPSPGQIPWLPSARKCSGDHTPRPRCRTEHPVHPCGGLPWKMLMACTLYMNICLGIDMDIDMAVYTHTHHAYSM